MEITIFASCSGVKQSKVEMNRNGDHCIFDFEIPLMQLVWVRSQQRVTAEASVYMHSPAAGGVVVIHSYSSALAFRSLFPSSMDQGHS